MFRSIVCGVDDSSEARAALRVAVGLAGALECRLVLAYVVDLPHPPGASAAPGAADEFRRQEREEGVERLARIAKEEGAPEDAERRVETGKAADRLAEVAANEERPLLVVGSRGRGVASSALLGSTSTALAARATCPVLVVSAAAGEAWA